MKTPLVLALVLASSSALVWKATASAAQPPAPVGNKPPVCCFGPDCQATGKIATIKCQGNETTYQLDATGSFDPDGDPITFMWFSSPGSTIDDPTQPITTLRIDTSTNCNQTVSVRLIVSDGTDYGLCRLFVEVMEGESICPSKPSKIEMIYTGEDCSASSFAQDPSGVSCSGDPNFANRVRVLVTMNSQPDRVYFDGNVMLGVPFEMDGAGKRSGKVPPNSHIEIFSLAGAKLQDLVFHTSCSQPLEVGDQFGSIILTGYTP